MKFARSFVVAFCSISVLACAAKEEDPTPTPTKKDASAGAIAGSRDAAPLAAPFNCTLWKTADEAEEKLVIPKCGGKPGSSCHATIFEPRIKAGMIAANTVNKPALTCPPSKLIDKDNPEKSAMLTRSKPGAPTCPDGKVIGQMPSTPDPVLSSAEYECLAAWVNAVTAR